MTDDDDNQPDLFGGLADRDEAMERLAAANPKFTRDGLYQISKLVTDPEWIDKKIIFEDLTRLLISKGVEPATDKAWGMLCKMAINRRLLIWVGTIRPMAKRGSHGRRSPVYRIPDRRVQEPPPEPTPPPTNAYYDEEGRLLKKGCPVCGAPPSLSIGFFPRKGFLGMWYCKDHWPGWAKLGTGGTESGNEISRSS